jgi:hypothetical protein
MSRSHTAGLGKSSGPDARSSAIAGVLQRKCACGQHTVAGGECDECKKKQLSLQRHANGSSTAISVPPIVHDVLHSPGQPLDSTSRALFEARFGHDFSQVRVHTDDNAAESARAVRALAYTAGRDIVFGRGQYNPSGSAGRRLLAHEMTHVLQQGQEGNRHPRTVGAAHDAFEREADAVAGTLASASLPAAFPTASGVSPQNIQREATEEEATEDLVQSAEEGVGEVRDGDAPVNAGGSAGPEVGEEVSSGPATGGVLVADTGPTGNAAQAPAQSPSPKTPSKTAPKKITKIDVDLSAQNLTVNWSDGTTEDHRIASGRGRPNTKGDPCEKQTERNCTPVGDFRVGSLGNANTANSHGDAMSWYVGFVDSRGIGIHDTQAVPGVPASHGCVRVGDKPADDAFAKKINKNVVAGQTVVHVFGKAPTKPWTKPTQKPKGKPAPTPPKG